MKAQLKRPVVYVPLAIIAAVLGWLGVSNGVETLKGPKVTATQIVAVTKPPQDSTATRAPATNTVIPTTPTNAPPSASPSSAPGSATLTAVPPSATPLEPSQTPIVPTEPAGPTFTPWPQAPLCANQGLEHNTTVWHGIWNPVDGCHYELEHGMDPCTAEVAAAFPELFDEGCPFRVGHTNPSSPIENTADGKHGGHKYTVALDIPCEVFEGADNCVVDVVVQVHWLGNAAIEYESRRHSVAAAVVACAEPGVAASCGSLRTVQLSEFGQRVTCYQGRVLPFPDTPDPAFNGGLGQYFTIESVGLDGCRTSIDQIRNGNLNSNAIWTSKPTGAGTRPIGSTLVTFLARNPAMYQILDGNDREWPFTYYYICSLDGGVTFAPAGCRHKNDRIRVHEIAGLIPTAWDGLAGFDTDPEAGFITADAYVTQFGQLLANCIMPVLECHPVEMHHFPTGKYGGALPGSKISNMNYESNPSDDVCFNSAGQVVPCGTAGAIPSGWIGPNN